MVAQENTNYYMKEYFYSHAFHSSDFISALILTRPPNLERSRACLVIMTYLYSLRGIKHNMYEMIP